MNRYIVSFYKSTIINSQNQHIFIESLKFLTDLNQMNIPQLDNLKQKSKIDHLYITLMRRNISYFENNKDQQTGLVLSRLFKAYPHLLDHQAVPIVENLYDSQKALLRLQESSWHYRMSKSRGSAYKWYLVTGGTLFVAFNVYMIYLRVAFYMEHSFDILNPDIDYLIERY